MLKHKKDDDLSWVVLAVVHQEWRACASCAVGRIESAHAPIPKLDPKRPMLLPVSPSTWWHEIHPDNEFAGGSKAAP